MHNRTLELKLGIVDNDPLVLDLLTHYFVASHAPSARTMVTQQSQAGLARLQ